MRVELTFPRQELLDDIAAGAFLSADVEEGKENPHTLHQTFDICEEGNIERTARLMRLAFSEAAAILRPLMENPSPPEGEEDFRLALDIPGRGKEAAAMRIRETVHEFIVAKVLTLWLRITLPGKAGGWEKIAAGLKSALASLTGNLTLSRLPYTRPRRRLYPF